MRYPQVMGPLMDLDGRRSRLSQAAARAGSTSTYSTVTLFARLRGLSTSVPRSTAV